MSRADYDKIPALNWSRAKSILRSPFHFANTFWDDQEETDALLVGSLVHAMVLEGKGIKGVFAIKPKGMSFATNAGREWKRAQTLPILKEDDQTRIHGMAEALAADKDAERMIRSCPIREQAYAAELDGVAVKCIIDAVGQDKDFRPGFLEIKTSVDASEYFWAKRCCAAPFHYDGQAEFYAMIYAKILDLGGMRPWSVWLVVESRPPHAVACWAPDETMIASGLEKVRDVLTSYKACKASGAWPSYHTGIQVISAPPWRRNQLSNL